MRLIHNIVQINLKLITTLIAISFFVQTKAQVSQLPNEVKGYWKTSENVGTDQVKWKAQWIWLPGKETSDMMLARKTFVVENLPNEAMLRISASSKYILFVNGKQINQGPARSEAHHQSYDVLDIASVLQQGENSIAVKVHFLKGKNSYPFDGRAGLLAQLNFADTVIYSNNSWKVSEDLSWDENSVAMSRFQLFVNDNVDLSKSIRGWNQSSFDDSNWKSAQPLLRNSGWPAQNKTDTATHLTTPWTSLAARDIPYLIEEKVTPLELLEAKVIESFKDTIDVAGLLDKTIAKAFKKGTPINLKKDENTFLLFDFGEAKSGMAYLKIKGAKGTKVIVQSAPFIIDNGFTHEVINSNFKDDLLLSGQKDEWQAMYFKPTRYLGITVLNPKEDVEIASVQLHEISYPFQDKGFMRSAEYPWVKDLWEASKKTIKAATTDAYTDNYREKRQYAQTGYYAALGNYFTFGDLALQRRYLLQVAQEQLANGIMPAYAPLANNEYMIILDSNCLWIRSLYNYFLYSGDEITVKQLLPSAKKLIDLLHSYTNDFGLIDKPPYPYWLDHALNDRRGANLNLNGHYVGALEDFSKILSWLDEEGSYVYAERAQKIKIAIQTQFWNAEKQLFVDAVVDGEKSNKFSEHANAMALATKSATQEQANLVAKKLLQNDDHNFIKRVDGTVMVTPAMSYFLHKGLAYYDYEKASLELLANRFQHMLSEKTNQTLWEEWWLNGTGRTGKFTGGRSRSDAQTESVFSPALFVEFLLGLTPTKPGLKEFVLKQPSVKQRHVEATLPIGNEYLMISWKLEKEKELRLTVPRGVVLHVKVKSLLDADEKLIVNNKEHSAHVEQLSLNTGEYLIQVK